MRAVVSSFSATARNVTFLTCFHNLCFVLLFIFFECSQYNLTKHNHIIIIIIQMLNLCAIHLAWCSTYIAQTKCLWTKCSIWAHTFQEEPEQDASDFVFPPGFYWSRTGYRTSRGSSVPVHSPQDRASRMAAGLEEDLLNTDH